MGTPGPGPGDRKPVADPYDAAGGANPNHTWAPKVYTGLALARAFGYSSPVRSVDQTWDAGSLREQKLVLHTAAANRTWTGLGADARRRWGFDPTTSASSRSRSTPTPSRFARAAA